MAAISQPTPGAYRRPEIENLSCGKLRLDWEGPRGRLQQACPTATVRAVMTAWRNDRVYTLSRPSSTSPRIAELCWLFNSNTFLGRDALHAPDAVPAAAGIVLRLLPNARVYTLSRASSTRPRIAELSWLFNGNIFLRRDVLHTPDAVPAAPAPPPAPVVPAPVSGWTRFATWLRGVVA